MRGRVFQNNNYGNNRGREYRRPNDYNRNQSHLRENRQENNRNNDYEDARAMEMQRLIDIAGEHAKTKRSYNRHPEDDKRSDVSFNDNLSGYSVDSRAIDEVEGSYVSQREFQIDLAARGTLEDSQQEENTLDSLELDEVLPIEQITVETDAENNNDEEKETTE